MLLNKTNLCWCKSWRVSWRVIVQRHNQQPNNQQLVHQFNKISAKRIQSSTTTIFLAILRRLHLKVSSTLLHPVQGRNCRIMKNGWKKPTKCLRSRARKSVQVSALKFKNQLAGLNTLLTLIYPGSSSRWATHLHLLLLHLAKRWEVSNRRTRTNSREITEMTLKMMTFKKRFNLTRTILITYRPLEIITEHKMRTIRLILTVAPSYQKVWEV